MANTIGIIGSVGNTYTDPGIYYDKRFLDRLAPQLYFASMGDKRPLPTHSGTEIKWHRLNKFTANVSALPENSSGSEQDAGTTEFTAQPLTYGSWVKVSSELNLKAINPIVEEIMDELSDQAALSYDTVVRNTLHNTVTNQFAAGAVNEAAVSAVMTAGELRKANFSLRFAQVKGFEGNTYKSIIHSASEFDLISENATGSFIDLAKYTRPEKADNGEIGKLYGIRLVMSQNVGIGVGAGSVNTFRNFVFGKGCYGISELAGNGIKTIRQAPGSVADPLERFSTLGYTFMMAAKTLDANRGIEVYTASAAM